ncbi:MAG: cytochrome C [Rhodovulum sulfidophilum]|uniref:Cytochrome C n=1 Tax=Rhodovulum sulfidophilum TaxID=35806 RepID=A0A2W5NBN9_RHOSU|nr:MAG: cytochrome C [Rhodovulum sulfidophilum]
MMRPGPILLGALIALAPALGAGGAFAQARANYILRCAGCHGMEGLGTEIGGVPAFPNSVEFLANDDAGRTYIMHVPGVVGASLDDAEIAEVMNYVVAHWSETPAPPFTEEEVRRRRAEHVPDVVARRAEIAARLASEGKVLAPYPWP